MNEKPALTEEERVAPYEIDPHEKKLRVRSVRGVNHGGASTESYIRDFATVITDEPATAGGSRQASRTNIPTGWSAASPPSSAVKG